MQQERVTTSQRGFSLVELLLGLFLFSVVVLALAAMELTVEGTLQEATLETAAMLAAQERMEVLLATDFDALVSTKEMLTLPGNQEAVMTSEVRDGQPLVGMKTVQLTVHYESGGSRQVSLASTVRR